MGGTGPVETVPLEEVPPDRERPLGRSVDPGPERTPTDTSTAASEPGAPAGRPPDPAPAPPAPDTLTREN
jgi:hypothetical protein